MRTRQRVFIVIAVIFAIFSTFTLIGGCSRGPNEKQLKMLEESKSAALAVEEANSDCQNEKSALSTQLAKEKQKLEEMKQEKEIVTSRLQSL